MIQKKHIKKITTFLLLLVTVLTLVACQTKESVPYGEISDDAYLTLGDIKITDKDVYDNLRRQSGAKLPQLIEEKLFEGYITEANNLLKGDSEESTWAKEDFDKEVNKGLFRTDDIERIKQFKEKEVEIAIQKYVDSLFVQDSTIDRDALKDALKDLTSNLEDEDAAKGYYEIEALIPFHAVDIAKKIYANELLVEEVLDEDSDHFIKDTDLIKHYKSEEKGRHDANVFFFHFINLNEANAAFRQLNIKSNSRGHWFNVPDIRNTDALDNLKEDQETHVLKVLEDTNLTEKFYEDKITEVHYKKFYEAYSLSEGRDEILAPQEVLQKFMELYNIVNDDKLNVIDHNDYESFEDLVDLELEFTNGNEYQTKHDYDSLGEVGSSLRNYVYDTLTEEKPYSTLRSVGGFRYLIFKLDENYNEVNYISEDKDSDDNEKLVTVDELVDLLEDEDKGQDLLEALKNIDGIVNSDDTINTEALQEHLDEKVAEWTEVVLENKLTTSYVNSKVAEIYEDAKVEIYDNIVRTFYNQSSEIEAKGKNKKGNDLLRFESKLNDEKVVVKITPDELFESLEKTIGLETGIDLIINKYLIKEFNKKDGMFKDEDIDVKGYKKELKDLINNFSNNGFAEAGYPSSIGRESFLLMLFGTTDLNEAVELGYVVPELREIYTNDFDNNLDVDVYDVLSDYAKLQHEMFKGVKVSHILVYFDTDGDDSPNNPNEYFETLEDDQVIELKELILELYDKLLFEIGEDGLTEEKIKAVVDEYQSYTRIPLGDYKPEKWEKYRRAGINLKYEDLGSEITNSSNLPTGDSVLDEVFYDRAIKLHDHIMADRDAEDEDLVDNGLPYLDYAGSLNIVQDEKPLEGNSEESKFDNLDELMSNFGFHFIMVNNISDKLSAEYKASDDTKDDYMFELDDVEYNIYNEDSETITKSQVEYYLKGQDLEEGVELPSKVRQAFNKYFDPVFKLFSNDIMRVEILNNLLVEKNIDLHGKENRFETIREINRNQFHEYLLGYDDNYDNLYGNWFEDFGL